MTLKKVLYRTRVRITDSWKKAFMMHPLLRVAFISLLAAQATPNTVWAQVKAGRTTVRCNRKSSVSYGRFHRRSDGFRSGPRRHWSATHHL